MLTKEQAEKRKIKFIKRARAVHGDKYDYSKVVYERSDKKVIIICPIHGEFEQLPNNHASLKNGCPLCNGTFRKTTEQFIKEARAVHGDKYDYSKVNYINSTTKVKIICPVHGEFEQTPNNHLNGRGCYECGKEKVEGLRKTTEQFIKEAKAIHGDIYDYSKTVYRGALKKVVIICPKHGEFEQTPNNHLNGRGCYECGKEKVEGLRKTTEKFIEEARAIHGDKYDYSKVNYINSTTKVKIICPVHGEFEQMPIAHINQGCDCPDCWKEEAEEQKKTTEKFIEEARAIHGDKYDYSKVNYINSTTKVKIICPVHGEFEQTPNNHLNGTKCPGCSDGNNFLRHDVGKLYIMVDDLELPTMMKIGVSVREDERSKKVLQSARRAGASIPALHVAKTWEGPTKLMMRIEQMMHENYEEWNIKFPTKFDGYKEFFYYTPETAAAFDIIEETLHEIINANKAA